MQLVEISGNKKKHLGVQNRHDGRNIVDEIEREGGEVELCSAAIHYSYYQYLEEEIAGSHFALRRLEDETSLGLCCGTGCRCLPPR